MAAIAIAQYERNMNFVYRFKRYYGRKVGWSDVDGETVGEPPFAVLFVVTVTFEPGSAVTFVLLETLAPPQPIAAEEINRAGPNNLQKRMTFPPLFLASEFMLLPKRRYKITCVLVLQDFCLLCFPFSSAGTSCATSLCEQDRRRNLAYAAFEVHHRDGQHVRDVRVWTDVHTGGKAAPEIS